MIEIPTLQTERLTLRAFREDDFEPYAEMLADPDVMMYLGEHGRPKPRAQAWREMATFLGHWQLRGFGMWAVEETATRRLVGRIGCHYPEDWPGFELGWAIAREFWGRGFAFEGASRALAHAFETLNRDRVISIIHRDNERSIRLARRLGEEFERETELMGNPVVIYGITKRKAR
jgi:RimJ/RimL family protein N-acetyltransferase